MAASEDISTAISGVCECLARYTDSCVQGNDPATIIANGERLRVAVLEYERSLMAATGWSNPLRYLDPPAAEEIEASTDVDSNGERFEVAARYRVRVESSNDLVAFASGRFAQSISTSEKALETLCESEGWDPRKYPPGMVRLLGVFVDVLASDDP
jgi:hypothetical protein